MAQTCTPVSASLLGSADDQLNIWINGNGPYGPINYITSGTGAIPPISIPIGVFNATGPNLIAALNQDQTASVVESSWVIDITCSSGQHAYITNLDSGLKMYVSPCSGGSSPAPPNDGGGNAWYSPNYTLSGTYFTGTPTVITSQAAPVWLQPMYNPQTGAVQPWIGMDSNAIDTYGGCTGLYYRESVTLNPQPYTPPTFSVSKSANPTTIAKSYSAGSINYKLIVCNSGAPVNTPVTVWDNLQYNIGAYYNGTSYSFSPPTQMFSMGGAGEYGSPAYFYFPDGFGGNGACVTISYSMSMGDTMDAAVTTCTLVNQGSVTYNGVAAVGTAAVTISGCSAVMNTSTMTNTNTVTKTFTPTPTRTNTSTVTNSQTPTPTFTFTNTRTNTNTPSSTVTNTTTPTVTNSQTQTNTGTPTFTRTPTSSQTNTPTTVNTFTSTNTNTVTVTKTQTSTSTPTAQSTFTSTDTNTGTETAINTFTVTNTRTNTNTPTVTNTQTSTISNTNTATLADTATNSPSTTDTNTITPSNTPTVTSTQTDTPTFTETLVNTATNSPSPTNTATAQNSFTSTNTATSTETALNSFTSTSTSTITNTQSATVSNTNTATLVNTATNTPTVTVTNTNTVSCTQTPTATFVSAITVGKSVNETSAQSDDVLTYTIAVTITGNPLINGVVTDTFAPDMTFVSFGNVPTGTGSALINNGTEAQWTLPTPLAPGIYDLTYLMKVNSFAPADVPLVNQAVLSYPAGSPQTVTAPVTVIGNFSVSVNIYNGAGEVIKTIPIQKFSSDITNITLSGGNTITALQGPGSTINIIYNGVVIGTWDGTNNSGQPVSNGTYKIQINNVSKTGTVTSVAKNAIVNRSISDVEVDIFNESGEVVRRLYNVMSNPVSSTMTNVTLSSNVIKPSLSAPVSGTGNTSQVQIYIQDTSDPVTLVWDGSSDSGSFVTPGEYQVQVHWTDGNGNTTNIVRSVLVMASSGPAGAVLAKPNTLNNKNGFVTQFDGSSINGAWTLKVKIYTIAGELVYGTTGPAGTAQAPWDATGKASGLYIAAVEVDDASGEVLSRQKLKLLVLH